MNLAIYGLGDERRRQWIVVDLGVAFAGDDLPGVDLILPDIRYLVEERRNILGLVLTHAHEDHFGALIDLWPRLKLPVYATPFTAALLEAKRQGERNAPEIPVNIVPLGGRFTLGPFDIELVSMAHSIPESNGLIIRTPLGTVLHTGDWKIDPTPVIGPPTDEAKLRALGDERLPRADRRFHQCGARGPLAVGKRRRQIARRADPHRARRASRSPPSPPTSPASRRWRKPPPPAIARSSWSAAPWSGSRRSRARPAISTACRSFARSRSTAICRPTRWWRSAPAARASRARRSRASPWTAIPTSRFRAATA